MNEDKKPPRGSPTQVMPAVFIVLLLAILLYSPDTEPALEGLGSRNRLIKDLVSSVPRRFGTRETWVNDGTEIAIPGNQSQMLALNASLSRNYVRLGSSPQVKATLVLLHSEDARAMSGHNPSSCFPANGWKDVSVDSDYWTEDLGAGYDLRLRLYRFIMGAERERELVVVSGFVLPGRGFADSPEEASWAAGRALTARLGIAQFQILFQMPLSNSDIRRYSREILSGIPKSIFDALHDDLGHGETTTGDNKP